MILAAPQLWGNRFAASRPVTSVYAHLFSFSAIRWAIYSPYINRIISFGSNGDSPTRYLKISRCLSLSVMSLISPPVFGRRLTMRGVRMSKYLNTKSTLYQHGNPLQLSRISHSDTPPEPFPCLIACSLRHLVGCFLCDFSACGIDTVSTNPILSNIVPPN